MAVDVVVGLEAVEIEDREAGGALRGRLRGHALELARQRPAVAEPGERVGGGLLAAGGEHPAVVAVGDHEPHEHGHETGAGEREREHVGGVEVVVDQQAERRDREDDREQDLAPLPGRPGPQRGRRRPGAVGQQQHRGGPAGVVDHALLVGADRDAVEVEAVRDGEHRQPAGDPAPRARPAPAGHRQHPDDEPEHHHVRDRIAQVGGDARGADPSADSSTASNTTAAPIAPTASAPMAPSIHSAALRPRMRER